MKLTKPLIAVLILAGCFLLTALIVGFSTIGTYNTEASLRNLYNAKVTANTAVFDNMFKKISQSAQVTDAQKNALKDIFTSYAAARSGNGDGGQLMKWVQESVPTVNTQVFTNLQNIITGARDEWTANQIALVDIAREYNQNLAVFPSNVVLKLFGFTQIDAKVITSSRTSAAFATGKDNDTDLHLGK